MCLSLTRSRSLSFTPYNESKIRWKLVDYNHDSRHCESFYLARRYKMSDWNTARLTGNPTEEGFHVFVTYEAALSFLKTNHSSYDPKKHIRKIKVSGFLRRGYYERHKCETWKKMKFVK